MTTQDSHNRHIHDPSGITASERPQTHASDRVATTIGCVNLCISINRCRYLVNNKANISNVPIYLYTQRGWHISESMYFSITKI